MSKFLFTLLPSNDLGVVTRALPVAIALRNKGHEIIFSVHRQVPSKLVKEEGFKNILIRTEFDNLIIKIRKNGGLSNFIKKYGFLSCLKTLNQYIMNVLKILPKSLVLSTPDVKNMDHFFALNGMLNKNYVLFMVEAFMKVIKETEVEFVIDFWNPYATIAAKILKIPLITINQFDVHPSSNGFIWWEKDIPKYKSALPVVNKVLSNYGLAEISKPEELTIGDLTLTLGMQNKNELKQNSGINHIGFLVYRNKRIPIPKKIEKLDKSKPLVWVYSGNPRYAKIKTDFDSEILLELCIDTLAKEDINIVLSTGYHSISKRYFPLPKNVIFVDFIDGLEMSKKADIMIHHGGYGSCQTSLISGTPSLIIPTFSERESNARRIAKLGTGEYILPFKKKYTRKKSINKREFIEKFHKLLSDEKYQRNASEISKELEIFNSENRGIRLIENFVKEYKLENAYLQPKPLIFTKEYSKNLKLVLC